MLSATGRRGKFVALYHQARRVAHMVEVYKKAKHVVAGDEESYLFHADYQRTNISGSGGHAGRPPYKVDWPSLK